MLAHPALVGIAGDGADKLTAGPVHCTDAACPGRILRHADAQSADRHEVAPRHRGRAVHEVASGNHAATTLGCYLQSSAGVMGNKNTEVGWPSVNTT